MTSFIDTLEKPELKNLINMHLTKTSVDDIYSVFPISEQASDYDSKVSFYDAIIGNKIYNRLIWGNRIENYLNFCNKALNNNKGSVLDAGCGSLVFTAKAYSNSTNKLIILTDRSLGMLKRARERLIKLNGSVPKHIVLLQADVFNLPFKENSFDSVISQGLLHMFDNKKSLLESLERVKTTNGKVYFTSLVGNNFLAKKYLSALHNAGEVALPHSSSTLETIINQYRFKYKLSTIGNMLYAETSRD